MSNWANEFKAFIMRGNVVGLAVAVVIGVSFKSIVDSIVEGLLMPLVNLLTGGYDFKNSVFRPLEDVEFRTGAVFQACLNFLIIGFCLFLVVKAMNTLKKKEETKPPEPTVSEKLLTEIRDLIKAK